MRLIINSAMFMLLSFGGYTSVMAQAKPSEAAQRTAPGQPLTAFIAPSVYKEHGQNWDVVQAYNNMMFFANMHGLMSYDGHKWELKQLPSSVLSLHFASDGLLYAGLTGDFGIVHQHADGSLFYESIFEQLHEEGREVPPHNFIDVYKTMELNGIIYFITDAGLYSWNGTDIHQYSDEVLPVLISDYESVVLAQNVDGSLFMPAKPNKQIEVVSRDGSPARLAYRLTGLLPRTSGEFLVIDGAGQQHILAPFWDEQTDAAAESPDGYRLVLDHAPAPDYLDGALLYDMHTAGDRFYITTFSSGIFEVNAKAELIQHHTTGDGLKDNFAFNIYEDNFGIAWLVGTHGITTIDSYSGISVLSQSNGLSGNILGAGINEEHVYVGSSNGLYYSFWEKDRPLTFQKILDVNEYGTFTQFVRLPVPGEQKPGYYGLSDAGLFRLEGKTAEFIDHRAGENVFTSSLFPGLIFTDEFVAHLRAIRYREDGTPEISERINRVFEDAVLDTGEDVNGNIWFSGFSGGLYTIVFRDADDRTLPDEAYRKGPFNADFRIVSYHDHDLINEREPVYISTIDEEIVFIHQDYVFQFDHNSAYDQPEFDKIFVGQLLSEFVEDESEKLFFENNYFIQLLEDHEGYIWFTELRNKSVRLGAVRPGESDFLHSPMPELNLSYNTRLLHCSERDYVLAVNYEHIYAFDRQQMLADRREMPGFEVFLREATTFTGDRILLQTAGEHETGRAVSSVLDYADAHRALSFRAATNYHHTAAKNHISFRLHPVDSDFIAPEDGPFVTYRNLREGSYTLELRAVNHLGEVAQKTALNFVIQPPWYRSVVAYMVYIILFGFFLYGFIEWRLRNTAQQRDTLKSEVKKRTAQLQKKSAELSEQRDQLAQANLLKVRLLRMTAHDLRSPLTAIMGYSGLIEMEESAAEMKAHARTIHDISSRMRAIVQRMLASGARNLEQIDLELSRVNLREPLEATIKQLSVFLKEKNQDVRISADADTANLEVVADEVRVAEIFENLLSNAIKYSPAHSSIFVRLRSENEGSTIAVEIQDQGKGFSDADLNKIFGEYQQLSAKAEDREQSMGLGLFIVKQLMMVHGGSVEVKNAEQGGSCFILYFPVAAPAKES